jgi:opacity protein-like surface antigen
MIRISTCTLLALAVMMSASTPAQAQWVVAPYVGINLAGDTEFRRGGPGVSVTYFAGRLGFEFDLERYNHFFKDKDVAHWVSNNCGVGAPGQPCTDLNTDAIGFMGNVVAALGVKGADHWHPYVVAGVGLIRSWITDPSQTIPDTDQNNVALDLGGGTIYSFNKRIGLRGDMRYFRAFVDPDTSAGFYANNYGFLRATVGVTFGLP